MWAVIILFVYKRRLTLTRAESLSGRSCSLFAFWLFCHSSSSLERLTLNTLMMCRRTVRFETEYYIPNENILIAWDSWQMSSLEAKLLLPRPQVLDPPEKKFGGCGGTRPGLEIEWRLEPDKKHLDVAWVQKWEIFQTELNCNNEVIVYNVMYRM